MAKQKCDRAKAIRRGHRGVTTKLVREVDEIVTADPSTAEAQARLKVIFKQLEAKSAVLSELDREISSLCDLDEVEGEIEEAERVIAKLIECKRRIEEVINPPSRISTIGDPTPLSTVAPPVTTNRLPKLILSKFRGDVTKWTAFWDSFSSAVHERADISKVDKFNYLNSLLEGSAANAIQGLTLTESNYDTAVELLKERFGRPQQIITAHMDELLKIPACVSDRPSSLRQVYDKVNVHIRGLTAMDVCSEQYGSLLIPVIMSKLPNEIRLLIAREAKEDVWQLEELMSVVKAEVEAREASEGAKLGQSRPSTSTYSGQRAPSGHHIPSASTLVSNEFKLRCAYCKGPHYSASCDKVQSVKDRRDILLKGGKCFNCLKPNHKVRDCRNSHTCRTCGKRHHQSICDQGQQTMTPVLEAKETSTLNSLVKDKRTILLQTAQAIAVNPVTNCEQPVRILLDNGSQRSYITNELQRKLKLVPDHYETLQLNTFGDKHHRSKGCDVVQFHLCKPYSTDSINVTALCFPVICTTLPSVRDVQQFEHLSGLPLADDLESPRENIDVLIGSDFYWDIVTGDIKMGSSGPIAISSKLGWLLSGPIESSSVVNLVSSHVIITEGVKGADISTDSNLTELLKQFWETESLGITQHELENRDDEQIFLQDIKFKTGHYEVDLPWRQEAPNIPNHFRLSLERLKLSQTRLLRIPELLKEYHRVIEDQLSKGIIEQVEESQLLNAGPNQTSVHYLPHHAVVKQDRQTTKVRVVYDGSAKEKFDSHSLNDCLMTGPNYIPKLFNVLIRFRSYPIALTSDIEKAFLMIHIAEADRTIFMV